MFNPSEVRKQFPLLAKNPDLIYFDNAATTHKPQCVLDAINDLYVNHYANPHALDYKLAVDSTNMFDESRKTVANFINAKPNEVVFTSGDTGGMNMLVTMLADTLQEGDEVLLSVAEHASNILPWFRVKHDKNITISYIELNDEGKITIDAVKKAITPKTKIISLAHVTNVLGNVVDFKEICKIAHSKDVLVIDDAAQSIPHIKTDVKDLDIDFMVFSGHKIYGPTGIGIFYGKEELLNKLNPPILGGGMNTRFDDCGNYSLLKSPQKFEAGTVNLEGAVGLAAAIKFIESYNIDEIAKYEKELRDYAISKMKEIEGVKIYNEHGDTGIITFNYKDVFAQDLATHFASYNICVRSGQHCAKILTDFLGTTATVRVSFSFYNTKEEVDKFIEVLKKGDEYLDVYFR